MQSDDKGLIPAVGSRSKLKSLHLADGATATHGWSLAQSKGNTPYRCGVLSILIQRTCAREAWLVAIASYKNFLIGQGHLVVLSGPIPGIGSEAPTAESR